MSVTKRILGSVVALAWATAMLGLYYYTHKPLNSGQVPALAGSFLALFGWGSTLIGAHAVGRWVVPALRDFPVRDRLALRIGLGLGLLGLLVLALAAFGGLRPLVAWVVTLAFVPLGWKAFWTDLRGALPPKAPARWSDRLLAFSCLVALGVALLTALAPSTAWDALAYHLTGPRLYISTGHIQHNLDLVYLGFPQWPAMLFTWAMLLGGPVSPAVVHFSFALLTLALLPNLVAQVAPGRAWLAAALLLSSPALVALAGWAYVEWLTMFCITAAAMLLLRWRAEEGSLRWLLLAGVFGGLAFSTKYTTAGSIVGLAAAILLGAQVPANGRGRAQNTLRVMALFGVTALLTTLPWLIKNVVLTGNPVYPFFFPGKYWDAFRAAWFGRGGTGLRMSELIVAPWTMMKLGFREEDIGPLPLALLPLLALGWRARRPEVRRVLKTLLVICLMAFVVWMIGLKWSALLAQYRLFFPVFVLVAVLGAAAFDGLQVLQTPSFKTRWVAGGLLGLTLTLTTFANIQSLAVTNPLPVLLGLQPPAEFLTERLGLHYLAMESINALPPGHRVVFLWEPRNYYCTQGCEPDAILDRWWHLRRTVGDASAIAANWRAAGMTHVLIFSSGAEFVRQQGLDPISPEDWSELDRLIADELILVKDLNGAYQLYALR